ncbi:MAG: hypothetical protein ACOZAR_00020 [Patescibacteria group bacterium]
MKRKLFVLLILPLILAGCLTTTSTKPDGSIADQTKIKTIDYSNYWQYLKTAEGKDIREQEITSDDSWDPRFGLDYLRRCGGMLPQYYFLVTENDQTVASEENMIKVIDKIKTPEEAVAFFYAKNCGLLNRFGSQYQFVNKTEDGYLVSLIYYNWFGCGNHAHKRQDYLLREDGNYKLIKETKLELGKEFCGD